MATIDQLTHAAVLDRNMLIPVSLFGQTMRINLGQITGLDADYIRIEFDTGGDNCIAYGETRHISCRVLYGWSDVTEQVTVWSIVRDSGDAVDDAAWALKQKVKDFAGEIDIVLSATENDLGSADKTTYTITATLADETQVAAILEI